MQLFADRQVDLEEVRVVQLEFVLLRSKGCASAGDDDIAKVNKKADKREEHPDVEGRPVVSDDDIVHQ